MATTEFGKRKTVYSVSLFSRLLAATIKLDPTLRSAKWGRGVESIEFDTFLKWRMLTRQWLLILNLRHILKRQFTFCKASFIFKVGRK
jgi:hypothetical protein